MSSTLTQLIGLTITAMVTSLPIVTWGQQLPSVFPGRTYIDALERAATYDSSHLELSHDQLKDVVQLHQEFQQTMLELLETGVDLKTIRLRQDPVVELELKQILTPV